MILSFKRDFPWQKPTNFKAKIKAGVKIHTLRRGERWRPGMIIHFWEENPRNKTKNPAAFQLDRHDLAEVWKRCEYKEEGNERVVDEPLCFAVEPFELTITAYEDYCKYVSLKIGGLYFDTPEMLELVAVADGFDNALEFIEWFWVTYPCDENKVLKLTGQVVHWTDQVYDREAADALSKINL